MSYTADYKSINLTVEGTVREALTRVALAHGWDLIDNIARVEAGDPAVNIRVHGSDPQLHDMYHLVLRNPDSGHYAYDVGMVVTTTKNEDGVEEQTAALTYDPYQGSIEREWGKDCNGLRKEVIIAAVQELSPPHIRDMSMEEVVANFATDPETNEPLTLELLHKFDQPVRFNTADAVESDVVSAF